MRKTFVALVGLLALAGCGNAPSSALNTTPAPSATTTAPMPLVIRDPWIKTAESGLTAAFGTLVNTSGEDLVVVSGSSTVAGKIELHEVVMKDGKMEMRPKEGGFSVAANGSHELKPGGDHIMFLDITAPVKPGEMVAVTLTLKDGRTMSFAAVGKDFAGGNESYNPGTGMDMK